MTGPTPTHTTNTHTPHQSLDRAPRHISHAQLVSVEEGMHFTHPEHTAVLLPHLPHHTHQRLIAHAARRQGTSPGSVIGTGSNPHPKLG